MAVRGPSGPPTLVDWVFWIVGVGLVCFIVLGVFAASCGTG